MAAKTYRKKPVQVQAVRYDGTNDREIGHFAGLDLSVVGRERALVIHTLEGNMHVSPGDYVIRGVRGEHYPCKPEIFEETYEEV